MKSKIIGFILFLSVYSLFSYSQSILRKFESIISKCEFKKAQLKIKQEFFKNEKLTDEEKLALEFEIERLDRIRLDFKKELKDVIKYIQKYIPTVTNRNIKEWEKEKSLEYMIIDGKKKYFNYAAPNLFRINKECKRIKKEFDEKNQAKKNEFNLVKLIDEIIAESKAKNNSIIKPMRYQIDYSVIVDSGVVPEGEIIRCWLPYPKEIIGRQQDIKLLNTYPNRYIISDNDISIHKSIYFEQPAQKGKTEFKVEYQYICNAFYNKIDPTQVKPYNRSSEEYQKYTAERPPHIVFTQELKALSKKIVGNETNPFIIAKKIFGWIDENIPWTSEREYSTIKNLSMFAYENMNCDCGIQTMLFMTLARMNGIPTRWQSGWEPTTMHDWCQMYIEPYGWIPVDVTSQPYGVQESEDENIKWFYLGDIDNRRLVVNDDYSAKFYPAKIHPRSETVDFQRGELEWRGGNIYFDKWDYNYNIKEVIQ